MGLILRLGQRLNAILEPIWWGIHDATGLTRRRTRQDLELAQQLRAAGMTEQADALANAVAKRLLAR